MSTRETYEISDRLYANVENHFKTLTSGYRNAVSNGKPTTPYVQQLVYLFSVASDRQAEIMRHGHLENDQHLTERLIVYTKLKLAYSQMI